MKMWSAVVCLLVGLVLGYLARDRASQGWRERAEQAERRLDALLNVPLPTPDTVTIRLKERVTQILRQRDTLVLRDSVTLILRDSLATLAIDSLQAVIQRDSANLSQRDSLLRVQREALEDCRNLLAQGVRVVTGPDRAFLGIPLPRVHLGAEYDANRPFVYAGASLKIGKRADVYGDLTQSEQRQGWRAGVRITF